MYFFLFLFGLCSSFLPLQFLYQKQMQLKKSTLKRKRKLVLS